MKTISVNLYQFSELSEEAKQTAIDQCRPTEVFWADENRASMEKFADLFPIKVTDWSYGGRGEGVSFRFEAEYDEIEEMSGQRLANWLWNNLKSQIYARKYYKSWFSEKYISHPKVKSEKVTEQKWRGRPDMWGKYYNTYSGLKIENYSCPLTGYCMDNELLSEIWNFIDKPDSRNFRDLLEDCFAEWIKACNADIDYQNSDEAIIETIESNEYNFTENGKLA